MPCRRTTCGTEQSRKTGPAIVDKFMGQFSFGTRSSSIREEREVSRTLSGEDRKTLNRRGCDQEPSRKISVCPPKLKISTEVNWVLSSYRQQLGELSPPLASSLVSLRIVALSDLLVLDLAWSSENLKTRATRDLNFLTSLEPQKGFG